MNNEQHEVRLNEPMGGLPKMEWCDLTGLICGNIEYVYKENGFVDWKKMIPKEYFYPNLKEIEKDSIEIPEDISTLDDKYLLIKLGGLKELARIRGLKSVKKDFLESTGEKVVVKTTVVFTGNYETRFQDLVYEDIASATVHNTGELSVMYLETIASNRSLARAIRNALGIDITAYEEIKKEQEKTANEVQENTDPRESLKHLCSNKKVSIINEEEVKEEIYLNSIDNLVKYLKFKKFKDIGDWNDWNDISIGTCWRLMAILNG